MKLESARLYYRKLLPIDDVDMFALDSNAEVHRYLHNNPYTDITQSRDYIALVRAQYEQNGIGRMATILKETGEFIGWAGLKLEHNVNGHEQFYDVGYRFIERYRGNGYATEAAIFFVNYGFEVLKLDKINASALSGNIASRKALQKAGLEFLETYDYNGEESVWLEIINPASPR